MGNHKGSSLLSPNKNKGHYHFIKKEKQLTSSKRDFLCRSQNSFSPQQLFKDCGDATYTAYFLRGPISIARYRYNAPVVIKKKKERETVASYKILTFSNH